MAGKKCGQGIKQETNGFVCDWEDDPVQTNYPDLTDGANCQSLIEAKNIYLKEGKPSWIIFRNRKRYCHPRWHPCLCSLFCDAANLLKCRKLSGAKNF
ncbi:CPCC family cysteine-rich protein [Kosakonia oryzendophytica]|uniref:CPCC family cysteine-rich protein n=1 Tax=Kosakonia oryzendophytica TaxID=1005665 RepID=UPI003D330F73